MKLNRKTKEKMYSGFGLKQIRGTTVRSFKKAQTPLTKTIYPSHNILVYCAKDKIHETQKMFISSTCGASIEVEFARHALPKLQRNIENQYFKISTFCFNSGK